MIISWGDLHLADDREWSLEVSDKVIDYIANNPLNNSDNVGVFLGDLTEKATLYGTAYSLLYKLFKSLKFKKTYIVVGNHDLKENKAGKLSLTYEFLRLEDNFKNIEIVDKMKVETIENSKVLFLPFIYNTGISSVKDYETLTPDISDTTYDIIYGHFANTSERSYPGTLIDVSYLKTKHWCFGHVHTPAKQYIGSIIPNSISEAGVPRFIRTYDKDVESIIEIPKILEYSTVKYPEPLPEPEAQVMVYTVTNCASEITAKQHYNNVYIKDTKYDLSSESSLFSMSSDPSIDVKNLTTKELFEQYKLTSKVNTDILNKAEKYLTN